MTERFHRGLVAIAALLLVATACAPASASVPAGPHLGPWNSQVVIIGIDVASEKTLGQFPYSRGVFAKLLDAITPMAPAVVAFDVDFDLAKDSAGDDAFHSSLVASKVPIVLAYGAPDLKRSHGVLVQIGEDWLPNSKFRCADAACSALIPSVHLAAIQVILDNSGVTTKVPMVMIPRCLALATCTISTLQPLGYVASSFVTGAPLALGSVKNPIALPEWSSPLPVDSDTAASIVYSGAPGSFTKHGQYFSLGDVLAGSVAPSSLKGKVVVVGAMGLPQSPDQVRTPTSSGEMWGPEAQANITAMFLSQSWAP